MKQAIAERWRAVPPPLRRFGWFCVAGGLAFVVDAGVLHALLRWASADPYSARVVSVLCAMTTTWLFNRSITFRDGRSGLSLPREWGIYVASQLGGLGVNYGVYALLVTWWSLATRWPVLGVAAGSIAGLVVNYAAARRLVFRSSSG